MNKKILLLMAFAAIFLMNCSSDDDDDATSETLPVPVSKTTTSDDSSTYSLTRNLLSQIFNDNKSALATQNVTIEYDGRVILKKTSVDDYGNETVQNYYYNNAEKGLLDSIVMLQNQQFSGVMKYTIENDQIKAVDTYDASRNLIQRDEVTDYDGDKPVIFTSQIDSFYGPVNLSTTVTYSGDDIVSVEMNGTINGDTFTSSITYTYDDKNNSDLNVITKEQPFLFKHNIKTYSLNSVLYGTTFSMETNYEYTYNNEGYPLTSTSITISNYGDNSTESVTIEYEDK